MSKVPPFTLFEYVGQELSSAFGAKNVKGGTGVVEAAMRYSWAEIHNTDWFVS